MDVAAAAAGSCHDAGDAEGEVPSERGGRSTVCIKKHGFHGKNHCKNHGF